MLKTESNASNVNPAGDCTLKMQLSPRLVIAIVLSVLFLCCGTEAMAAGVQSIQSGSTTIVGGLDTSAVAITAVDPTKSILIFSSTHAGNEPQNFMVGGELTNATTITFARSNAGGGAGTASIAWQVVEFASGVLVQRGQTALGVQTDVALSTDVDLNSAFVLATFYNNGVNYNRF